MKKIIIAILILLSGQLSANPTSRTEEFDSIKKQIGTFLNSSKAPVYQDVVVVVKFKLTEKNTIVVTSIASNEYEITNYIRTTLNNKELLIDESSTVIFYSIPVRFTAKRK